MSLVSGLLRRKPSAIEAVEESEEGSESGGGGADTAVGESGRRVPASKVGGRRRRARAGK